MDDIKDALIRAFVWKRSVDGMNGRPWKAKEHWEAEQKVAALLKLYEGEKTTNGT